MMSDDCDEQGLDPPPGSGSRTEPAGALVLELVIAGTDPMRGTVGRPGEDAPVAFQGWIDLMSAITSLGARPQRPGGLAG
jgi:hypothetical protein